MDSATGKLVRQEDKDGLIVGESYLHQPEESFKIGDVTYTYDKENTKNILQIANLSGHPGKDEIVIYYKASVPDSNRNSDLIQSQIRQKSKNRQHRKNFRQ